MFIPKKSSSVWLIRLPRSHLHQEPLDTAQGWKIPAWKFQKVKSKNRKEGLEEESLGIPQFCFSLGGFRDSPAPDPCTVSGGAQG